MIQTSLTSFFTPQSHKLSRSEVDTINCFPRTCICILFHADKRKCWSYDLLESYMYMYTVCGSQRKKKGLQNSTIIVFWKRRETKAVDMPLLLQASVKPCKSSNLKRCHLRYVLSLSSLSYCAIVLSRFDITLTTLCMILLLC